MPAVRIIRHAAILRALLTSGSCFSASSSLAPDPWERLPRAGDSKPRKTALPLQRALPCAQSDPTRLDVSERLGFARLVGVPHDGDCGEESGEHVGGGVAAMAAPELLAVEAALATAPRRSRKVPSSLRGATERMSRARRHNSDGPASPRRSHDEGPRIPGRLRGGDGANLEGRLRLRTARPATRQRHPR